MTDLTTIEAVKVVDARAMACPGPLLEAKKSMASDILADVREGTITAEDGWRAFQSLEKQTNEDEATIQQNLILNPQARQNPGKISDLQTDILELRQEIFRSKETLSQMVVTGEINPEGMVYRLEQLEGG